jgi:hypothetical protein
MPILQPPKERHAVQDTGSAIQVIIPNRKNYITLIAFGGWLVGWACGEMIFILGLLLNAPERWEFGATGLSGLTLFLLAWLGLWTVAGGFTVFKVLWQFAGKEVIEVSHDSIKIQRAMFGIGRTKEYLASYVKNLRIAPIAMMDKRILEWSRAIPFGPSHGSLAFDYGAQTVQFGGGADEAEAKQILDKIVARFPQYREYNRITG